MRLFGFAPFLKWLLVSILLNENFLAVLIDRQDVSK
jgi:hypothetical protein